MISVPLPLEVNENEVELTEDRFMSTRVPNCTGFERRTVLFAGVVTPAS